LGLIPIATVVSLVSGTDFTSITPSPPAENIVNPVDIFFRDEKV